MFCCIKRNWTSFVSSSSSIVCPSIYFCFSSPGSGGAAGAHPSCLRKKLHLCTKNILMLLFSGLVSSQGYRIGGEHCEPDAPGVDGHEVSGGEELCAQRFSGSQRPAGQSTVRQNQWLWPLQGPGSRWQLLQSTHKFFNIVVPQDKVAWIQSD